MKQIPDFLDLYYATVIRPISQENMWECKT
jgi:hypothetical protein